MTPALLRIGSRASTLARTQTEWLGARIGDPVAYVWVKSEGDQDQQRPLVELGGTGVFTAALHRALLDDRCDAAIHSLKDLPVEDDPGIVLGAVPVREDVRDAWLSRDGTPFDRLARGATVATGSPRRVAQLRRARPDLNVVGLRGNVDTRLRKLREGAFDGMVLAMAGLKRLGLDGAVTHPFDPELMLPAPGQGALAVTIREGDTAASARVATVADVRASAAVSAERAALHALRAGCHAPVGALALVEGGRVTLRVRLLAPDGSDALEVTVEGGLGDTVSIGRRAAEDLLGRGGGRWLATP